MTYHEYNYVSQDLGFEGIDDFNVVQGVFDNENMNHSDAGALLLSMREEGWALLNTSDMSEFEVRTMAGTNVPADAPRTFESESQSMSRTTLGSAGSPETLTSQTPSTAETPDSVNGSRPYEHQDPAFSDMWRQRSESIPEASESWNSSRPWEHQDPSLLGTERRQARGDYCIWCGHSGRDFHFPTDPVGPLQ
jgi:hypothetical protein